MRGNGYKCYQTKCGACEGNVCKEPFDSALGCDARLVKPQTHADRIRAMSDEELAAWLADDSWDCHDCPEHERLSDNPLFRHDRCDEKCAEHCLGWLRQTVKDGDNE